MADLEEQMLQIVRESVPAAKRAKVSRDARLRDVGVDSLTLVIIVGQFVSRFKVPVEHLQKRVGAVVTVGQLVDLGREALGARHESAAS